MFSQLDPSYKDLKLPKSNLSIGGWGCFLCSLTNLAGGTVNPVDLMKTQGGFVNGGLLVSGVLAKALGLERDSTVTKAPAGWCVGVTDKYKSKGVPTHFVCVNVDESKMIDPLTYPAKVEDNKYDYFQYRTFKNVKVINSVPDWAEDYVDTMQKAGVTTPPETKVGDMPLYQLVGVILKIVNNR